LYDWYDKLEEEIAVFVHGHKRSWHQANIESNLLSSMKTDYFWSEPYGGIDEGLWKACCDNERYNEIYNYVYNGTSMPRIWNRYSVYPCCGTFFVKTSLIRSRPREEYRIMKDNLIKCSRK